MGGLLIYWAEMVENVEGKPLGIAKAVEQLCTVIQCSDRQAYRWLSNVTEEEKAAIKGFLWKWKKNGFPHDGDDFHNDLDKAGFPGLSATFAYLRPPAISMKKWAAWWHRRCNESSTYER